LKNISFYCNSLLSTILGALSKEGHSILVAHGGKGGNSNNNYKFHGGVTVSTKIELQVVADVGLVGFESSGKSLLMHQLVTPIHARVPTMGK
jgi:GTPase involved in cell partitioning and DNA repair